MAADGLVDRKISASRIKCSENLRKIEQTFTDTLNQIYTVHIAPREECANYASFKDCADTMESLISDFKNIRDFHNFFSFIVKSAEDVPKCFVDNIEQFSIYERFRDKYLEVWSTTTRRKSATQEDLLLMRQLKKPLKQIQKYHVLFTALLSETSPEKRADVQKCCNLFGRLLGLAKKEKVKVPEVKQQEDNESKTPQPDEPSKTEETKEPEVKDQRHSSTSETIQTDEKTEIGTTRVDVAANDSSSDESTSGFPSLDPGNAEAPAEMKETRTSEHFRKQHRASIVANLKLDSRPVLTRAGSSHKSVTLSPRGPRKLPPKSKYKKLSRVIQASQDRPATLPRLDAGSAPPRVVDRRRSSLPQPPTNENLSVTIKGAKFDTSTSPDILLSELIQVDEMGRLYRSQCELLTEKVEFLKRKLAKAGRKHSQTGSVHRV
eukprot:195878_1